MEGVIVGEGSVISMGVYIGQSTKIYDRETGEVSYGRIPPAWSVVSGNLPAADGSHSLYCAVIVGESGRQDPRQTSINELLRGCKPPLAAPARWDERRQPGAARPYLPAPA